MITAGFEPIAAVARVLADFPRPWFVLGGWAIDLFLGRVTRRHEDLEVGIFRQDQQVIREHLPGWRYDKAVRQGDSGVWVPWDEDEWLALPVHQVRVRRQYSEPAEFEFFLNERESELWRCRRNPACTRPVSEIVMHSASGLPILVPEVQLLYKAQGRRPKDEHDFQQTLPALDASRRAWLKSALATVQPSHRWITEL